MRFKVTFSNEPEKNGTTTSYPRSITACEDLVTQLLTTAVGRATNGSTTVITIEVKPGSPRA